MSGMLEGKTALIFGVANRRSIAWAIAQALAAEGATLAFTYQGERIEAGVRELAGSLGSTVVLPCDVTKDEDLDSVFEAVGKELGGLDILIHAVAYAAREDLDGRFTDTKRGNFAMALDISAYSLTAMVQRAEPMMVARGGGSVIAMTYLGGERAVPQYNVMGVAKAALEAAVRYLAADLGPDGIRVNAISAGPVRTLSAAGIAGFKKLYGSFAEVAPLRASITPEDVGKSAVFLASDLSSAVTGEILYVDGGFNVLGVPIVES
jgi:enoyl-[acyl-carrier protein] reductase I